MIVRNATSIEVEWSPPAHKGQNGVIRGYLIFVQPVDDRSGMDELSGDTFKYNIMDGSAERYTINGLKPDTSYTVQVSLINLFKDMSCSRFRQFSNAHSTSAPESLLVISNTFLP